MKALNADIQQLVITLDKDVDKITDKINSIGDEDE